MTYKKIMLVIILIFSTNLLSFSFDLEDFFKKGLKTVGISALIKELSPQLNEFINNIMLSNRIENKKKTRVVPIYTIGKDVAIGAAQITGDEKSIKKVKHVISIEKIFKHKHRVKLYIPDGSSNIFKINRIYGVSVSALIDIKI